MERRRRTLPTMPPKAVFFNAVSPATSATVGTALVSGRDVSWTDTRAAPRVAIVNESLARAFFPGQSPLGHRMTIGSQRRARTSKSSGWCATPSTSGCRSRRGGLRTCPTSKLPEFTAGNNLVAEVRVARSSSAMIGAVRESGPHAEQHLTDPHRVDGRAHSRFGRARNVSSRSSRRSSAASRSSLLRIALRPDVADARAHSTR